jgi:hypothetical protein
MALDMRADLCDNRSTKTEKNAQQVEDLHFSRAMIQHMGQEDSTESPFLPFSMITNLIGRGVFTDSSLGLVLYYHYADTNDGIADADYLFGWNQITWSGGWPVV